MIRISFHHCCRKYSTYSFKLFANRYKGSARLLTNSKFFILLSSSKARITKHLSSYILDMCFIMPLSNFLYSTSFIFDSFIFFIFLSFMSRLSKSFSLSERNKIFQCVQNPFSEHLVTVIPFLSYYARALLSSDSVWF